MEPECKVRLDVFEGPLDLLLHLITRDRLDITDIPISLVTNQYLEYLELLKALDIEVAAEYLLMAATLIQIKSRMLLPSQRPQEMEEEDPRLQITVALQELKKAKELADRLNECPMLGRDVFLCPGESQKIQAQNIREGLEGEKTEALNVSVFELVEALRRLLKGKGLPRTIEIERARVRLSERIEEIEKIIIERGKLSFFSLFDQGMERRLVIVTFLAILELSKRGIIRLFQKTHDADIVLIRRKVLALEA